MSGPGSLAERPQAGQRELELIQGVAAYMAFDVEAEEELEHENGTRGEEGFDVAGDHIREGSQRGHHIDVK